MGQSHLVPGPLNFNFRFRKPFAGSANYSYDLRALCVRPYPDSEQVAYESWKLEQETQRELEREMEKAREEQLQLERRQRAEEAAAEEAAAEGRKEENG